MKKILLGLLIITVLIVGCSTKEEEPLSENALTAKQHLEEMGYEIIEVGKESYQEFSNEDLLTMPAKQVWAVQNVEPDEYLDIKIDTIGFTIKNHPLDGVYNEGETQATVFLVEGEVIGGWSYPIAKNPVAGGPYSLDGKTPEEVKGDYYQWLNQIDAKFSN